MTAISTLQTEWRTCRWR